MTQARFRAVGSSLASLVLGVVLATATLPAVAAPEDDLFWYFNVLRFQEIHDSGITGEGVTIAVIDSPINLDVPTLQGADIRVQESPCMDSAGAVRPGVSAEFDVAEHGTNVVSYIVGTGAGYEGQTGVKGVAPGATVLTYAVYISEEPQDACYSLVDGALDPMGVHDAAARAMNEAIAAGADIISVSQSWGGFGSQELWDAMITAVHQGVIVVGALSNNELLSTAIDGPPGTFNGAVSVLGAKSNGELNDLPGLAGDPSPNDSEYVQVVGPGWAIAWQGEAGNWAVQKRNQGTSIATPIVAGTLALAVDKYPEATGNQILQSMIHNTGQEGGEPLWDPKFGWGFVVPSTLLAADPSQYPDINPLVVNVPLGEQYSSTGQITRLPLFEDMFPEGLPSPSATTSPDPSPSPDQPGGEGFGTIAIVGGIALLIVILAIVFTVIAVNRKKNS